METAIHTLKPTDASTHSRLRFVVSLTILAIAFGLRVMGLNYGLPFLFHQDEPILVNHALALGVSGPNPHFFVIPSLTIYILFFLSGLIYVSGHVAGLFINASDFASHFLIDPTYVYIVGRFVLGTLFGVGTVGLFLIYLRRYFSVSIAMLSAMILAIAHIHVQQSHFIYADIPLTFFATGVFLCIFSLSQKITTKSYICAGILFGLGMATKYTMFYFVPALLILHMYYHYLGGWKHVFRNAIMFGLVSLAAFAIAAPYTFLDWNEFWRQIVVQAESEVQLPITHHLFYSIIPGIGMMAMLFAVIGIIVLFKSSRRLAIGLSILFVNYYLVNIYFSQPFARYMLPLIPILCICSAVGWSAFSSIIKFSAVRMVLLVFFLFLIGAPSFYSNFLMMGGDTRIQATDWLEQNIPSGSVIIRDHKFFSPGIQQSKSQIKDKYKYLGDSKANTSRRKRLDLLLASTIPSNAEYEIYTLSSYGQTNEDEDLPLFLKPVIEPSWNRIDAVGGEYLIINYEHQIDSSHDLLKSGAFRIQLLKRYAPFIDSKRKQALDVYSKTSLPHLPNELFSRNMLGPFLEIYQILPKNDLAEKSIPMSVS